MAKLFDVQHDDCHAHPEAVRNKMPREQPFMKRFMIERNIPNVGSMSQEELKGAAGASCDALEALAPKIQWQHSYVAGSKTFCVYLAVNKEAIKEHAQKSGFPADTITEVPSIIDPISSQ